MPQRVTKKPYFLLPEPVRLNDDLLNRLLGLAVVTPEDPIGGVNRPARPLKPRDGIDYLYPEDSVICNDFKLVQSRARSAGVSARFESIVKLSLGKSDSSSSDLSAAGFRRITMEDAPTKIQDLLATPTEADGSTGDPVQREARAKYRKEVLDLLYSHQQHDHQLAVMTSFLTCTDLTKNQERSKSTSANLEARTGAAGQGTSPDVGVGADYSRKRDVGAEGSYVGEYLIACSYLPLFASERKSGFSFFGYKPWSTGRPDGSQLGHDEMWSVGQQRMKGDMAAVLGGGGANEEGVAGEPDEALSEGEEEAYAFALICGSESDEED